MKRLLNKSEKAYDTYIKKNDERMMKLQIAITNMIGYFIGLGDDPVTAENKTIQLADEIGGGTMLLYQLGYEQKLIDSINASSLPYMDAAAKAYAVSQINV